MNKLNIILTISILSFPVSSFSVETAEEQYFCEESEVIFAFLNGVQTTVSAANRIKLTFQHKFGKETEAGESIRYEVLYNYSDGFEDFVETFEQRVLDQEEILEGRFELFFESLQGGGNWWDVITDVTTAVANLLGSFTDWYQATVVQNLTSLFASPATEVSYRNHQLRIDNWILEGKKLLFVAHSQGNLFANIAYKHATKKLSPDSVKLIHVAPASPLLNGPYTLANLDFVINGLRLTGSVPDNTTKIPPYLVRPASPDNTRDVLGHGLLEIYLNPYLDTSNRINEQIKNALNTLVQPEKQGDSGFFTATLTWNGSGDVDLHVSEPSGNHIYYARKIGQSGYLDVDNTVAYGPEHFVVPCDLNRSAAGVYTIAITNYARADGRTATVQISSLDHGELATKSIILQDATGNAGKIRMFRVNVTYDVESGRDEVEIL